MIIHVMNDKIVILTWWGLSSSITLWMIILWFCRYVVCQYRIIHVMNDKYCDSACKFEWTTYWFSNQVVYLVKESILVAFLTDCVTYACFNRRTVSSGIHASKNSQNMIATWKDLITAKLSMQCSLWVFFTLQQSTQYGAHCEYFCIFHITARHLMWRSLWVFFTLQQSPQYGAHCEYFSH